MALQVIILAAGKGKRMASTLPKVMHRVGGIPMLVHVVQAARSLNPKQIHVVYGNGGETIREMLPELDVNWVFQKEQLGTGHAVLQALPACDDDDQILVLYGDVPLITTKTLHNLVEKAPSGGAAVLIANFDEPTGFGRILRDADDNVIGIVEERDATTVQKSIRQINTGIITASGKLLKSCLSRVSNNNAQNEYYLTDVIGLAANDKLPVSGVEVDNVAEVKGVNDPWQLSSVERYYQQQQAYRLAMSGVVIMDPARLDVRGSVNVGPSTRLDINVILDDGTVIGSGCDIGSNVVIKNSTIGDNVRILANTVIDGAVIDTNCSVGPFARLRPGSVMKSGSRVGNFVEMKKTVLGENSKASHLTYLGDAVVGKSVNIGAGTITCNYDGVNKWTTEIGDYAFIGSNTSLVAPIKIGVSATIAAGSAVTKAAPDNQLTITRAKQISVPAWKRPSEKKNKEKSLA